MPKPRNPLQSVGTASRFIAGLFGFVFFGIGVTVIVSLWLADGFDEPPVFFKIFGSLIALAFVGFGGTMLVSAILSGGILGTQQAILDEAHRRIEEASSSPPAQAPAAGGQYVCPHCGATLGERTDVSPLGDVKCPFCGSWFNIHGRRAS